MSKLGLYRRIRAALVATNKRTDSSIITECQIVKPLADNKGTDVVMKEKFSKQGYSRKKTNFYRTTADRRK